MFDIKWTKEEKGREGKEKEKESSIGTVGLASLSRRLRLHDHSSIASKRYWVKCIYYGNYGTQRYNDSLASNK